MIVVFPDPVGPTKAIVSPGCFYDIQQGQIHIDGKDIKDYDINSLRSKIGVVLQDTYHQ
jgi:ABC-type transport system involved in Fe-S cluster assembly fused permease/ATPase subunit